MLNSQFVIIGTLISSIGGIAYLIDTLRGKAKPNRVTFLLWSIAPFIAFAAELKQGVGLVSLMTFAFGFLPLVTFLATFVNNNAQWKLTRIDLFCGALSLLGLLLWFVTKVGNTAILFSIISDALAGLPTIIKSYKYPQTETVWPWLITSLGVLVTLFSLSEWTFASAAFIFYIFVLNLTIFVLVRFKIGSKVAYFMR